MFSQHFNTWVRSANFCDKYSLRALKWEISRRKRGDGGGSLYRTGEEGFAEGGLHQIFIRTQRSETETRLLGNGSLLSCDSDSVGGWRDSEMIPSQSSFILLDEEEMPPPQSNPRAC